MGESTKDASGIHSLLVSVSRKFVRKRIYASGSLKKIIENIGWLFFDKFLRMGIGLFVGVWVARYLGPEQFGALNYSIAFVALFGSFATFGLDSIVVRDLVKNPQLSREILGSTLILRLLGGIATILCSSIVILVVRRGDTQMLWLVFASASTIFLQAFDTIDLHFQAKLLSKYTVWAKNGAFVFMALVRVVLVLQKAPLLAFAFVSTIEAGLAAAGMFWIHQRTCGRLLDWRPAYALMKLLLGESWPLILSSAASILNMRIGQVLLGGILNDSVVGNYSAAVRISEIWLMVPGVIGASIFPSLIATKERNELQYRRRLKQIFLYMSAVVLPFALVISLGADWFVHLLYGDKYAGAGTYLAIHIWSGVPYLTCFAFSQMYYIEKMTKIAFYVSLVAAALNLIWSIVLIPRYGGNGTAFASLLTAFGANFFGLYILNRKTGLFWRRR